MEPQVSTKNTKNEILTAYEELLQKVQEKKTEEPKKIQERQKQETIVKNAAELSYEGLMAQKEKKEQFEREMASLKAESDEKIKTEKEKFEAEITEKKGNCGRVKAKRSDY